MRIFSDAVYDHLEAASRLRGAFPKSIAADVDVVLKEMPVSKLQPTDDDIGPIQIEDEILHIPCRIYCLEPSNYSILAMNSIQRMILGCLYTRHHNGYIREKFIRQILKVNELWALPFIFQLLGEYVLEIIQIIADQSDVIQADMIDQFVSENPGFIKLLKQRTVSYWNCYYRYLFPDFKDYPGYQAITAFGLWERDEIKRLIRC
ncbi:MAG: hypothetical protein JW908_15585 [Anaerolineales bacterium]|nr:hypothetical protein [Anaerolineales bacterium]